MAIIILLLILLSIFLYAIYIILKWLYNVKALKPFILSLIGILVVSIIINNLFFKKMEFIQSKVYPHLYLIKHPISDKDSLHKIIKKMVIQKMNTEFIGNEEKYKYRYTASSKKIVDQSYQITFMEYYKGWGSSPIGEAGTAHFIDNEEDPGGFSSEYLSYYTERFLIGKTEINYCKNDTINYTAILHYIKNKNTVKHDTLINLCEKNNFNSLIDIVR